MDRESSVIYHIAERSEYDPRLGEYVPAGFASEGFVHCSRWSQVRDVATTLFNGRSDLVILEIAAHRLRGAVCYEDLYDTGISYPHIYAPIGHDAITDTLSMEWPPSGIPTISRAGRDEDPAALSMRSARRKDREILALMNGQLREDEGSDFNMAHTELVDRMRGWLSGTYDGWLFLLPARGDPEHGGGTAHRIAGYAMVNPASSPLHIRQLFIQRGLRRAGFGKMAVELVRSHYGAGRMQTEARADNSQAVRFWHTVGFRDRVYEMRWDENERHGQWVRPAVSNPPSETTNVHMQVLTDNARSAATFLVERLKAFNDQSSEYHLLSRQPGSSRSLAVMLTDDSGSWLGGVSGHVHWGWLEVGVLWVDPGRRGQGHGRALLAKLETLASERGATRAKLSTFSFQARGLYEKAGYQVVGEITDFPPGEALYWMRKDALDSSV